MHYQTNRKGKPRGFSLLELLVIIGIIGTLAGISLAAMSGVNGAASSAAAKAQAQRIAAVFNAGIAAGSSSFANADGVDAAMNAVGAGTQGGGTMASTTFRLPGITSSMDAGKPAIEQARHYLSWNGTLVFNPSGAASGSGGPTLPPGWSAISEQDTAQFLDAMRSTMGNPQASLQDAVNFANRSSVANGHAFVINEGQLYSGPLSGGNSVPN